MYLQSQSSMVFNIDIHPAAKIGRGIMLDHGSGIVIGETAEIGDNTSLLHSVTLGGSGKEMGDRHPKVGRGVMIGAGAKILGNIHVGDCARIAAGSVVLKDVPPKNNSCRSARAGDRRSGMQSAVADDEPAPGGRGRRGAAS